MPEYFDVVDEQDRVIDSRSGRECVENGLLHRAILVFLDNPQGEIYLQKRASDLLFYPGHWSASVTGHVSRRPFLLKPIHLWAYSRDGGGELRASSHC